MAKLIVSFEGALKGHYFLDKERFTIGRNSDSDIILEGRGVSNIHAVIVTISNDHVLEDARSTNGILVNAKKVEKHILQNNDVIELSGYQLKYINQRATSGMDFDKTMIMRAAQLEAEELPEHRTLQAKPQLATAVLSAHSVKTGFPLGGVKNMQGQQPGEEILISRPLKTFGQPGMQVVMISRRPHGYYVTHVEGKKHPRVNGKSIGTQPVLLQENDLIEAGDVKLEFFMQSG
ncbi:MAG TPA: FHA domain-containing protein [Sulfuriferula sp.]|nr:FHA domain-containing protein [Sulfuriferula sp.]